MRDLNRKKRREEKKGGKVTSITSVGKVALQEFKNEKEISSLIEKNKICGFLEFVILWILSVIK